MVREWNNDDKKMRIILIIKCLLDGIRKKRDKARMISLATWYYQVSKTVWVRVHEDEGSRIREPPGLFQGHLFKALIYFFNFTGRTNLFLLSR